MKELVLQTEQKFWIEFGEKMDCNIVGNKKLFYNVLKNIALRNRRQSKDKYNKIGSIK